jgi:hypothetical protein
MQLVGAVERGRAGRWGQVRGRRWPSALPWLTAPARAREHVRPCNSLLPSCAQVAERFPWRPGARFVAALHSHTSVLGLREAALAHGAAAEVVDILPPARGRARGGGGGGETERAGPRPALAVPAASEVACARGGGSGACGAGNGGEERGKGDGAPAGAPHQMAHCGPPMVRPSGRAHGRQEGPACPVGGLQALTPGGDGGWPGAEGWASGSGAGGAGDAGPPPPLHHLFAYPLECNFSGLRYPGALAAQVQAHGVPASPSPSPSSPPHLAAHLHRGRGARKCSRKCSGHGRGCGRGWAVAGAAGRRQGRRHAATRPGRAPRRPGGDLLLQDLRVRHPSDSL